MLGRRFIIVIQMFCVYWDIASCSDCSCDTCMNIIFISLRYYKTDIKGASQGSLKGVKLVIKDTIAIAGVPMMNGSKILEGYMPEFDATVVTRVLDAGRINNNRIIVSHFFSISANFLLLFYLFY